MAFAAHISASSMATANATLEAAGWGPDNFSVRVYAGARPSYAALHAWGDPAFQAAVEALPNVVISELEGQPAERVQDALSGIGGDWDGNARPLTGSVTPGLHRDEDGALWWVIQAYDTATYPDPTAIPALIRRARVPGEVYEWVQPIDQYDAYYLVNPFTNEPDVVLHEGEEWRATQGDGAGLNTWEPGVFGWELVNPPEEPEIPRWVAGGGTLAAGSYDVDVLVIHDRPQDSGNDWVFRSTYAGNTHEPGRDGTFDRYWEPIDAA
jgi:hypothetical protein